MPSKQKLKHTNQTKSAVRPLKARLLTHQLFFPLVVLTLLLWFVYRSLFQFPVWFDEIIGKAVFFGLPVWLYVTTTGFRPIIDSFRSSKLQQGLLRGLAVGGIFGFIVLFLRLLQNGGLFYQVPLFSYDRFWWELLLAMVTAFWETIFFYSFIMTVVMDRFAEWSLTKQVVLVAVIFVMFHIPNTFLRFQLTDTILITLLLSLFAIGQGLMYARRQNAFMLIMVHTIWGMSLLLYF